MYRPASRRAPIAVVFCAVFFTGCPKSAVPTEQTPPPSTNQPQCNQTSECPLGQICSSGLCMNDSMAQTHHDGGIELAAIADAGHDTPANVGDAGNENGEPHNDAGSLLPPPAPYTIEITTPTTETGHFTLDTIAFKAVIGTTDGDFDPTTVNVLWYREDAPTLFTGFDGTSMTSVFTSSLPAGTKL